ncbi:10951_t:CDS:1, partial [Gigaspora margarita]
NQLRLLEFLVLFILHTFLENIIFGKIDGPQGSLKKHPFNLLNLVFKLHNGYGLTIKDNLINMKSEYIHTLYEKLLNFYFTKYQQPIQTWWKYELIAAQQYLAR